MIEYITDTKLTGRRLCDDCGKEMAFGITCGVCGCDVCVDHSINAMFVPSMSPTDRVCNQCMSLGAKYVSRLGELETQKEAILAEWEQTGKAMRHAEKQYESLPEWKKRAMRSVKISQYD